MEAYVAEWLNILGRWAHFVDRHRLDRLVVLFHLARQSSAAAGRRRRDERRASAASCGRCTAAASTMRRSTAWRRAALPETLHWFYWEAYSTWLSGHVPARADLLVRRGDLSDRSFGCGAVDADGHRYRRSFSSWAAGSSTTFCAGRRSARNERGARRRAAGAAACWPGGCASCSAGAARSSSSARRSARSWWRTCSSSSFPVSARWSRQPKAARAPDPEPGIRGEAALHAQHLFHAAGAVHDDQQSLCDDLCACLQLAGADCVSRWRGRSFACTSCRGTRAVHRRGRS